MSSIRIRFHTTFNELLSPERRDVEFTYKFKGLPSIKHLAEAMRIPHTEIGGIYVNGRAVNQNYLVQDLDRIIIYPVTGRRSLPHNISNQTNSDARFLLDNHLGKLATYLRMLGFDTRYNNQFQDDELAELARTDGRILLTRDRGLLMRRSIEYGYFIRSMDARKQVVEVMQQYDLYDQIRPFERCIRCNGQLVKVDKINILHRLEPLTRKYYDEFCLCQACDRIYWKGSHFERMQEFICFLKDHR